MDPSKRTGSLQAEDAHVVPKTIVGYAPCVAACGPCASVLPCGHPLWRWRNASPVEGRCLSEPRPRGESASHKQYDNYRGKGVRPRQGLRSLQAFLSGFGVRNRLVVRGSRLCFDTVMPASSCRNFKEAPKLHDALAC